MKKNLLIALIVFSSLNLFSQIGKGTAIIQVAGNYTKVNTENGVITNQNATKGQYLNVGASIGYFLTDRLIAGAGLDYNWAKETRDNRIYLNNFLQQESMDIKSKVYIPNIYLGYYYKVFDKLYFSTSLKLSYGKIKTGMSTMYTVMGSFSVSDTVSTYSIPVVNGYESNSETKLFSAEIYPEVTYFISSKFGVCLNLGGISYSMYNWETHNTNLAINFKPDYWSFGIKFKL